MQLSPHAREKPFSHQESQAGGRKVALFDLSYFQLQELLLSWGEPSYRADQLYQWLYVSLASEFAAMSNLPLDLRERLEESAHISRLTPLQEVSSPNGLTRKVLFGLPDGETIESVLMLYDKRNTVCLSTQVGCALGCAFCATGQGGFARNLTPGEIVEQVVYFARDLKDDAQRVTNAVFMGMGEPLANYQATWKAVETLMDHRGYDLGARRITISTAGVVPGIQRLSRQSSQVRLAVSLHAPDDALRDTLVPINRRYPLKALMAACQDYVKRTGRRVTFEYALAQGVNDSRAQAVQLARLLKGLLCHVNLIPVNPVEHSPYQASSEQQVHIFRKELGRLGVSNTVRLNRGAQIEAGCGQLRSRWHGAALKKGEHA